MPRQLTDSVAKSMLIDFKTYDQYQCSQNLAPSFVRWRSRPLFLLFVWCGQKLTPSFAHVVINGNIWHLDLP